MDEKEGRVDFVKRLLVPLFAACTFICSATAEESDLSGTWNFSAVIDFCDFTGQAKLTPNQDRSTSDYSCEMTARQYCPELNIDYTVNQTCKVRNTRGQVWIQATIKEFLRGQDTGNYYPDNFNLSVQSSSEMTGALVSAGNARPAIWRRADGSIS